MMFETDRSSILSFQKCPRDRFYSRHFGGKGIEKVRKSLALCFGAAFHVGTEPLLLGKGIEAAVASALLHLNLAFSAESVDLEEKQTMYAVEEQRAIAEGLLRAWWIEKGQRFLEEFEVLEVEQEGRATLLGWTRKAQLKKDIAGKSYELPSDSIEAAQTVFHSLVETVTEPSLVLMFRPDALVRERGSGDLYIVSWKTASTFGAYTINHINSDMQSMSEIWGVEQVYKAGSREPATSELQERPESEQAKCAAPVKIEGVVYLFAIKGQRRMDDYLGFKTQDTPLAYCWKKAGVTPDEDEYAWRYKWPSEEEGRKFQQLSKGFRKLPVWEAYPGGVKAWIDALAAREITPRHINPFEAIFPESMPVSRRADEIESWRRQIVSQESRVRQRAKAVEEAHGDEEVLDREFPQHTQNCYSYNSPCQFFDACFKPAVHADPLGSGLYKIRMANHPEKGNNDD